MMEDLVKYTRRLLRLSFKNAGLNKSQMDNLAELVIAFFFSESFTLREIASKLLGESNVKHKLKRLQYFLDTLKLDNSFWQGFIKTIFSLPHFGLGRRKYLTLLIDATTLKDDFWILAASISYQGRAIPVYLKVWRGVNEPYDYWSRVKEFLMALKSLLPERYAYTLIADRGFQGAKMFDMMKEIKWDYVIRINDSYKIRLKDGSEFIQLGLFDDGIYEDVELGKKETYRGVNVAIQSARNEEGGTIKWFLATSLKDKESAVSDYKRRMWIEEGFKDLKGILKWEKYTKKIPERERIHKVVAVSCLSYAIQLSLGSDIEVPPSEEKKTSVIKRFQHLLTSGYRKVDEIYKKITANFAVNFYRLKLNEFFG